MKNIKLLLPLFYLFSIVSISAQSTQSENLYFCDSKELAQIPIQQDGRVKPLYVHANEMIKYITGKTKIDSHNAVTAYCLLSLEGMRFL